MARSNRLHTKSIGLIYNGIAQVNQKRPIHGNTHGVDPASAPGQIGQMISSKAKYALRAATVLAERYSESGWMPTVAIAEREAIPRKFLEAILVQLRDNGLIDSRRGSLGGHRLAR